MLNFMKILNNISRSQAIYRHSRISAHDLQSGHYAFVLAICKNPGCSQEYLAHELCINKSTVTRNLNLLEKSGYILRESPPDDKRQFSVYPTKKMLDILSEIQTVSTEWMSLLSDGIPQNDLKTFNTVLECMQNRARDIIEKQEENK